MADGPPEHSVAGDGTDGGGAVSASGDAPDAPDAPDAALRSAGRAITSENARSAALATLCLVLFLTFLDITIVSVALAGIQTDLHAGVSALQWIVGAYALTFAACMLTFGTIGDQFGRKKVMLAGIGIFIAGAAMAGVAPLATSGSAALAIVIAGRAVMGVGAAASEPGTLSMLRHIYPEYASRNWALGVWSAVSGSALALGPVVGGALVYAWGWPSIFWFNVLFGLIALVATIVVIPENSDPTFGRTDLLGAAFGAVTLAGLIFAVIHAESAGFGSPVVIALFCVSAVFAALFVWQEGRAEHPLLDLQFLHVPRFATPNIVAFCAYFATFAIFFFTALYLEEVVGYNGGQIAKVFLPMTVLMILSSLLAGRWTTILDIRWSIAGGCAAFAAGLLWTNAVIGPRPPYASLAAALALTGIGIGACVVPITSSVLAVVPPERSGMAASTTNTSREVGAVMGVAVLGAIVIGKLQTSLVDSLTKLGLPKVIQSIVINGVLTGQVPSVGKSSSQAPVGQGKLVRQVIRATYSAFLSGLHDALYVSAGLVAAAGVLTVITITVASDRAHAVQPTA